SDTLIAISPRFADMTTADKQITFWTSSSSTANKLYVATSGSNSGTSYNIIDTIHFSSTGVYEEYIIPLTAANGYNGMDEFVYFIHNNGSLFSEIRIDDFGYGVIPPCPKVTGLHKVSASATSVTIGFSSSGNKFDVEWGPVGFVQGTGTSATFTG